MRLLQNLAAFLPFSASKIEIRDSPLNVLGRLHDAHRQHSIAGLGHEGLVHIAGDLAT